MRVTLADLSFRLGPMLPAGKRVSRVSINQDGSLELELADKPDTRHHFTPNPKYPWFCTCGYAEHEPLMHFPGIRT